MKRRLQDELKQSKPFPTLEEEVYLEIQRTSQATVRWIAQVLKPYGLTESQFNVLRILRGCGPEGISNSGIAERMVKHDPDLTRLLDRLEAGGLVEKSRDVRDRRVVNARITKAGVSVVERISDEARRTLVGALRPLGPRRLGMLANLLELVRGSAPPDIPLPTSARAITRSTKGGLLARRRTTTQGDRP
jgi:DNA-binding MarR family transcriptional regulator